MIVRVLSIPFVALALLLVPFSIGAALDRHNAGAWPQAQTGQSRDEENRRYFTDLEVITHEGEELRFYSDILKDKLVVITFFYVNCPTAQPALITLFKLQKLLGEKLGRDIALLTISVDPERDTLDAIRQYAKNFNPAKGWFFITGEPKNMDAINRKLGNTLRLPESHLRQFLVGNTKSGDWMRLPETAPVLALAEGLHSIGEGGPQ